MAKGDNDAPFEAGDKLLFVGLGNPGPKYELTRHNIGFLWLDALASRYHIGTTRTRFSAEFGTGRVERFDAVCLKPQTFMNLSGQAVSRAAGFFDIDVGRLIVGHDDVDLPFGAIRLKRGGGHGGHNGLRSLDQQLPTRDYYRVRLGVGRPEHGNVRGWVLNRFSDNDLAELDDVLQRAVDATMMLVQEGLKPAQNRYHAPASAPGQTA